MNDDSLPVRVRIVEVAQALDAMGLMPNKSGNVSCRVAGGFCITPAAVPYRELTVDAIAQVAFDAEPAREAVRPSSEWRMHGAIYAARPDVSAIVHTHSPQATALACAGRGIPPFHYMIALAGGDVRCMPYATFGTAELAAAAVRGLEGRRAALLANHGVIAVGPVAARGPVRGARGRESRRGIPADARGGAHAATAGCRRAATGDREVFRLRPARLTRRTDALTRRGTWASRVVGAAVPGTAGRPSAAGIPPAR